MDYRSLTDADLTAKIKRYEEAIEEVELGGGVASITDAGRKMDYVRSNLTSAQTTLAALYAERSRRDPVNYPRRGRAISVEIMP
jgi:hypothetical protein